MGRIERLIDKFAVQTAVYWGNPQNSGHGSFTFDSPVEIKCRWEDKSQLVAGDDGQEISVDTEVLTNEDLDHNGYLYLGSLSDLTEQQKLNPMEVDGARIIFSVSKIPMVRSTDDFVRTIYLRRKWYVSKW